MQAIVLAHRNLWSFYLLLQEVKVYCTSTSIYLLTVVLIDHVFSIRFFSNINLQRSSLQLSFRNFPWYYVMLCGNVHIEIVTLGDKKKKKKEKRKFSWYMLEINHYLGFNVELILAILPSFLYNTSCALFFELY